MQTNELQPLDVMNAQIRSGIERGNAASPRPKPKAPPLPAGVYVVTKTDDPDIFQFKDGRKVVRLERVETSVPSTPEVTGTCSASCCGPDGVTVTEITVEPFDGPAKVQHFAPPMPSGAYIRGTTVDGDEFRIPAKTDPLPVVQFSTGAIRGTEKNLRYDLISPHALRSLAAAYTEGSKKYGDDNYLNGITSDNLYSHLFEHLQMWQEGDTSEDHLGHALWNLATLIHFTKTRPDLIKPRIYAPDYVPQKAVVDGTRYTGVDHMANPQVTDASLFGEQGVLVDYDGRKSDA